MRVMVMVRMGNGLPHGEILNARTPPQVKQRAPNLLAIGCFPTQSTLLADESPSVSIRLRPLHTGPLCPTSAESRTTKTIASASTEPYRIPQQPRYHPAMPGVLATNLAGLELANPVLLAAGTAGTLDEMADAIDLSRVGGIVTKSITPQPREGNQPWRVVPLESGMLNAVGLANPGLESFVKEYAPRIANLPTRVIGSIAGFSIDDYVQVAAAMNAIDAIPAVELNVSCPNVHKGCEFAADPELLTELIREVRAVLTHTRLFVKLSPIPTGKVTMTDIARAAVDIPNSSPVGPCKRPGADALCIANTTPAMAIDVRTRKPKLGRITGGLSGPAVHPMAVKLVFDVHRNFAKASNTPIIGIGGVLTWEHAAEFILAGATAVEVGTGLFADPKSPLKIAKGLESWVRDQRVANIASLIGAIDTGENQPR